ncbi:MAG: hypothetical protein EOO41_00925, partial [Methanobacteriota archaeon]
MCAGRSQLPDNLKALFRPVAMVAPDASLIAQVILITQGFRAAERIASHITSLFKACNEQLSRQAHYDFGLRALKSVLLTAGQLLRRAALAPRALAAPEVPSSPDAAASVTAAPSLEADETLLACRAVCESTIPKLAAHDVAPFHALLAAAFPDVRMPSLTTAAVAAALGVVL